MRSDVVYSWYDLTNYRLHINVYKNSMQYKINQFGTSNQEETHAPCDPVMRQMLFGIL